MGLDQRVARVICRVGVDGKGRDAEGSADRSPPARSAGMDLFDVAEVQQGKRRWTPRKVMNID
jgi:hypothetical protein